MTTTADKTPAPTPTPAPPVPTPAPVAEVKAPPPARKSYVQVLRQFSGYQAGEVVDATSWVHTLALTESRYILTMDKDQVAAALPCPTCRKKWLDEEYRDNHGCADDLDPDE